MPRASLIDVGGFDEELDRYWGYDNPNVGLRAHMKGYEFYCLPEIKCQAFDHNKHEAHPFRGGDMGCASRCDKDAEACNYPVVKHPPAL